MNKYISWLIISIFFIVAVQFTLSNIRVLQQIQGDFECFYQSGTKALLRENPYISCGNGGLVRNLPPTILLYALFPLLPIYTSQVIFFLLSGFIFLIGSYFLFKTFNEKVPWWVMLSYLTLVLVFFPFRWTLSSGHINSILFTLLTLALYFLTKNNSSIPALLLSIAISLSASPSFFLAVFLFQKRITLFLKTIFFIFILSLLTTFLLGFKVFNYYLNIPGTYLDFGISSYYNQSLAGLLARLNTDPQTSKLYVIAFALVAIIFFFIKIRQIKNNLTTNIIIWNVSILYILIFAPFAWQYHFMITIIPLVTTAYLGLKTKASHSFFLLLFFSYLLMGFNIKNPTPFENLGFSGAFLLSHVLFGALLLLRLNYYLLVKPGVG